MPHDDLVRMVNQIAAFFEAYPPDEARDGVRQHLKRFWDPSMRAELIAARAQLEDALHPIARSALDGMSQ